MVELLVTLIFLIASPAILLGEKETVDRVPLTEPLHLNHLQIILNTLNAHNYKGREWQRLCLSLGLTDDTINVIETDHKAVAKCLKECLSRWLRKVDIVNESGGPNWETLFKALKHIGENDAAERIDRKKQPACEIFTKHHKRLSYSIKTDPIAIATLLNAEGIIDNATLNKIQTLEDMGTVFLLQEMEKAIYKSYLNLKKFAIILTKFKDTDLVGKSILKAYGEKTFIDDYNEVTKTHDNIQIIIPRNYEPRFKEMRSNWAATIIDVVNLIMKVPPDQLMDYLFVHLMSAKQVTKASLLQIMTEECSLIDISLLGGIVERFEIQEAKPIIKQYTMMLDDFCKNVSLHFNELISNYPILDGERITIEVNKKVNDKTLNDIDDLLHIAFEKLSHNVKVVVIRESNSFIIICSFPLILTDLLVAAAFKNIELLKDEGVQQLTIGYVNVYSNNKVNNIQESINVSDLVRNSRLQVYKVQLEAAEYYLLRKEEKFDAGKCSTATDAAISYSWLTSLIIVCTTTMVLLLIVAYKRIMEKLSSSANKVDQCIKDTETYLLSFKDHTDREHAKSLTLLNGLEESLAECKAEVKVLHEKLSEYLHREKLAPIM